MIKLENIQVVNYAEQLLNGNNGLLLIPTLNKSPEFQNKIQWAFLKKISKVKVIAGAAESNGSLPPGL